MTSVGAYADDTTANGSNQNQTTSNQQVKNHPSQKYQAIIKYQKINYDLKVKSGKYAVYSSGAPRTSQDNMKPMYHTQKFSHRIIQVEAIEQTANGTWLQFRTKHAKGWLNANAFYHNARWLNVPLISQRPQLPTGCEMTAVTMMLRYAGVKVNKMQVAKATVRSKNPNKGFVGDPTKASGWYVFPKGIAPVVKRYLHHVKNMTGAQIKNLKQQINRNHPVVVWVANFDGFPNHAVTMNGYDATRIYYNDPWKNKRTSMNANEFNGHRKKDAYRTLSY
ncbi:C39 family peptidase [Philodulcilactobacillus myokoensis]|nr:C39 family peptidase [Philodulcilactobacillus myokoensis]